MNQLAQPVGYDHLGQAFGGRCFDYMIEMTGRWHGVLLTQCIAMPRQVDAAVRFTDSAKARWRHASTRTSSRRSRFFLSELKFGAESDLVPQRDSIELAEFEYVILLPSDFRGLRQGCEVC